MPDDTHHDDIDEGAPVFAPVDQVHELVDDDWGFDPLDDPDAPREHVSADNMDLERIPRRLWEEALAPLHRQHRAFIAMGVGDKALQAEAVNLAFELDMRESERRNERSDARARAKRTGYPLPTPEVGNSPNRPSVQVNLRLRADDHDRLTRAAQAVGLRPTTLARALVLNGATEVLREQGFST
jgi:hypothetical protein